MKITDQSPRYPLDLLDLLFWALAAFLALAVAAAIIFGEPDPDPQPRPPWEVTL